MSAVLLALPIAVTTSFAASDPARADAVSVADACGGGTCLDLVVCGPACLRYTETYGVITVINDGICDLLAVNVEVDLPVGTYGVDSPYDEDSTCHVIPRAQVVVATGSNDLNGGISNETKIDDRVGDASPPNLLPDPPFVTHSNYIHTSQTLQDVINVDIAKLRTVTERWWNGLGTWMVDHDKIYDRARISTSVRWNHPTTIVPGAFDYACTNQEWCSQAESEWAGNFHTDFLWCNASKAAQAIQLHTVLLSKADGGSSAKYTQKVGCPGTHHATRTWANTSSGV